MDNSTISAQELETVLETLPDVVRRLSSFEELVTWFQAQPCVAAINSPNYLIKTAPPRRELFVQFRMDDGSTVMRAIAVILYPDQTFDLADIYEP
ncbi:MAG: hypothetical protein ACKO24_17660 [Leptolyngbyaceae cyanobacterium]